MEFKTKSNFLDAVILFLFSKWLYNGKLCIKVALKRSILFPFFYHKKILKAYFAPALSVSMIKSNIIASFDKVYYTFLNFNYFSSPHSSG